MFYKGFLSFSLAAAYTLASPSQTVFQLQVPFHSPANESGIGFDLSPDYGRVAISYANGTAVDLGRTAGDEEYRRTYEKLSMPESAHPAPPYNDMGEMWDDYWRQAKRSVRKHLGLPASSEVGVLANIVADLRAQAEAKLGYSVEEATISVPHLWGIYLENIQDLCDYLKLRNVENPTDPKVSKIAGMAAHQMSLLAGNGIATCTHFDDPVSCDAELRHPDPYHMEIAFSVGLFSNALVVTQSVFKNAYWIVLQHEGEATLFPRLGYKHHKTNGFWDNFHAALGAAMNRPMARYGLPTVMVYGDSVAAGDPEFTRTLQRFLDETDVGEASIRAANSELIISRGAALLARQFSSRRDAKNAPKE